MSKNSKFKKELAEELRTLAHILSQNQLVRDLSPLKSAADNCIGTNPRGDHWEYDCKGLLFTVDDKHLQKYKNTIPGRLDRVRIELSVRVGGKCWNRQNCTDPFNKLGVDCKIEAWAKGRPRHSFICAWHLDRNQGDTDEASQHFVHPSYHFQFGGRRLPKNLGYGRSLLLEPPRLAHPPLDAILAVDFVLTNYFPDTWKKLRHNRQQYARVVQQAQNRCWHPYANATASNWRANNSPWPAKDVWPQLISLMYP